jgi:hypothetical protein
VSQFMPDVIIFVYTGLLHLVHSLQRKKCI